MITPRENNGGTMTPKELREQYEKETGDQEKPLDEIKVIAQSLSWVVDVTEKNLSDILESLGDSLEARIGTTVRITLARERKKSR